MGWSRRLSGTEISRAPSASAGPGALTMCSSLPACSRSCQAERDVLPVGLAQFGQGFFHFAEQAGVFDGDGNLAGEALQRGDVIGLEIGFADGLHV